MRARSKAQDARASGAKPRPEGRGASDDAEPFAVAEP